MPRRRAARRTSEATTSRAPGSRGWCRRSSCPRARPALDGRRARCEVGVGSRRLVPSSASMARVNGDANRELAEHGAALAEAVTAALPDWVVRAVASVAGSGLEREARAAGAAAAAEVGPRLRALLALDVDEQRVNPLMLVRDAVQFPAAVLRRAGVPPRPRSRFDV